LVGNIGHDAETKATPNGTEVVTFSVAVHERWTDDKKLEHKRTNLVDVEVWGPRTKFAGSLKKGTPVQVEGKVKTGTYKKDGVDVKTWVIKANNVLKIDYSQAEEISDANEDA
jgi:single-strand DNA-binding protein